MIPEATLNQIQERTDIVELVGAALVLRRAGRNFKACCPFHQEKTPSFIVNPDKQIFHCFGCGAGGDVFGFVMKFEKKDFREAVETLAERCGVEVPDDRRANPAVVERTALLVKAHDLAADFYHRSLKEKKEAERARAYLEKRGLSPETIVEFKIGYAPDSWDALGSALEAQVPTALLEKSGLVIAKKEGGHYDRFRQRIMFPILDMKGFCVAFGGRVMDDSMPKYLNSPETEIYSKGRHLYGLFQARKTVRESDSVIVVEGYMDLIACHQAGVRNVVASLGTALTPDQVRLIKRHTKNAIMLYDADKAGELATLRGLELFLEEGMEVRILRLPKGHDPDSYIREEGAERFQEALAGSKSLFEYKLALLKDKFDARGMEGKVNIANEMVVLFSKVQNEILRSEWLKQLAQELSISEQALSAELLKTRQSPKGFTPAVKAQPKMDLRPLEKLLIGLLLDEPAFVVTAREELKANDFASPAAQRIANRIFDGRQDAPSAAKWLSLFRDDEEAVQLISLACSEMDGTSDKRRMFDDCLAQMKRLRIRAAREVLMAEIREAERSGDKNRIHKFMSDINELNKREKLINEKK